jgi:hypothetical protein
MDPRLIDYHVFASQTGAYPGRWSWQIRRKSKPIGVELSEDDFQSESSALFARKRALKNFLSHLAQGRNSQQTTRLGRAVP